MNINGLVEKEWKTYEDTLLKANDIQIVNMRLMLDREMERRDAGRANKRFKMVKQ